ncbi:vWA domain-containing protein [Abyssalbus ytuae]|uniref:BatA and WFA domain-containing protein n=1 Tax=Abyssalbus ytuae TaxID=2926907 RepID=A0A9E6ZN22_9FLAO|nr:BatA and WFA domain-containing protein [Abyssalbus ytuae]UOB17360.1 BatA and WFA domain-containing protein [Abyssalbus ytuae]
MQFKHPEILWALFLLLIPIIIHLFQLRKFEKTPFTNVKFLKEVVIQSRKSSQLKKWLIFFVRFIAFTLIILAFAQPYSANRNITTTHKETVIYLDNSFSMQAKGDKGELLKRAVNELIKEIPEKETFSLFTNDKTYRNTNIKTIRNELLQLDYSNNQLHIEDVILKGKNNFSKSQNSIKNLVLISDFQTNLQETFTASDSTFHTDLVQLTPSATNNIYIDSVYIENQNPETLQLAVNIKYSGEKISDFPVSLYDKEDLIAKTSVSFKENNLTKAYFTLPSNKIIEGKVKIDDNGLQYDNTLFFSINRPEKINVLSINENDFNYLKKIYTGNEFNFISVSLNNLNYNIIPEQNLIVLNEVKTVPNSITNSLKSFLDAGGSLLIIPAVESNLTSYNSLLKNISSLEIVKKVDAGKNITSINFSHPLFRDVFDNKVSNFQYPKVNSYYQLKSFSNILGFDDGSPFLINNKNIFIFASALNSENSNFINSPLIVPTLYIIAKNSLQLPSPYYNVGRDNSFDINVTLASDEILVLTKNENEFIPQQQSYSHIVKVMINKNAMQAGVYNIKTADTTLQKVSFNYDRSESKLQYLNFSNISNKESVSSSVSDLFDKIKSENNVNELWKWFVIFAMIFLITEMLILKFLK